MHVVERERRYLEASLLSFSCFLLLRVCGRSYAVGRERRYLEASLHSSFCGLVLHVRSRACMQ